MPRFSPSPAAAASPAVGGCQPPQLARAQTKPASSRATATLAFDLATFLDLSLSDFAWSLRLASAAMRAASGPIPLRAAISVGSSGLHLRAWCHAASTSSVLTWRFESESAPFPLTHGVPFRHDAVSGEGGHGMGHPSPKYSAEFKQQAVRLCRERGGTYAEIARELGVDAGSISGWVKRADAAQAPPEGSPFKVAEENRRPRRGVERLRRENEVLLKASALFAGRRL